MGNHEDYIEATEQLAVELGREPTSEEIDDKMADMAAEKIDTAYENIMTNRREAGRRLGIPPRIPKMP